MIKYLLMIMVVFIGYSFFEYYNLQVRYLSLRDYQKHHNVPKEFKDKKIVFMSDLQFDQYIGGFDHFAAERVIEKIKSVDADLLIIGGDIIHNASPENVNIFDYLKELEMEKIAVLGNHDYRDLDTVLNGLEYANVKVLVNERLSRFGIDFYGLDDFKKGRPEVIDEKRNYSVALAHNPDYAMELKKNSMDLVLSGHFHGGQITFFGLFAPAVSSLYGQVFRYGNVDLDHASVYVSSGVGGKVFVFPMRFFAPPEIVVIEY